MLIFRNGEEVHAHLSECWRGTWSEKRCEPRSRLHLLCDCSLVLLSPFPLA